MGGDNGKEHLQRGDQVSQVGESLGAGAPNHGGVISLVALALLEAAGQVAGNGN